MCIPEPLQTQERKKNSALFSMQNRIEMALRNMSSFLLLLKYKESQFSWCFCFFLLFVSEIPREHVIPILRTADRDPPPPPLFAPGLR